MSSQLTSASGYNPEKQIIFGKPQVGNIPNSTITYKRIPISTLYPDGTTGELIIPTEKCFSFGVSENIDPTTKASNGYVFPICLHNKDGPTDKEIEWVETFEKIVEVVKDYLIKRKDELGKYDLERADLKKLNPLYYKRGEKGKIVEGTGPTLYAKLIVSKKLDKIVSMFFDTEGNAIPALDLLGKYCTATSAIKIESIFVGNRITLQVKLYEAEVKLLQVGMQRLLTKPPANSRVLTQKAIVNVSPLMEMTTDTKDDVVVDDDDSGSIVASDTDEPVVVEEVEVPKTVKKVVVKKVIKKKT